jgi:hypothetical protein
MKVVIEFYRVRDADNARALLGRKLVEALDREDAITIALRLAQTLDMPQQPDALFVSDLEGTWLYSDTLVRTEISS